MGNHGNNSQPLKEVVRIVGELGSLRKISDLTVQQYVTLLRALLGDIINDALLKVAPQRDPDEDIYWTTEQAAEFLGLWRQTIQEKKKKGLIKFFGEGRISRTTKAECKRYLNQYGIAARSIGKRVDSPVRKKWKGKKKK